MQWTKAQRTIQTARSAQETNPPLLACSFFFYFGQGTYYEI
jgi:hypothetical protein